MIQTEFDFSSTAKPQEANLYWGGGIKLLLCQKEYGELLPRKISKCKATEMRFPPFQKYNFFIFLSKSELLSYFSISFVCFAYTDTKLLGEGNQSRRNVEFCFYHFRQRKMLCFWLRVIPLLTPAILVCNTIPKRLLTARDVA